MNLIGAALRNLKIHCSDSEEADQKRKNTISGISRRMMDSNLRLQGGCLRYLRHMNGIMKALEYFELNLKKRLCHRLLDTNLNQMAMAYNSLKYHNTQSKLMLENLKLAEVMKNLHHRNRQRFKDSITQKITSKLTSINCLRLEQAYRYLVEYAREMDLKERVIKQLLTKKMFKQD